LLQAWHSRKPDVGNKVVQVVPAIVVEDDRDMVQSLVVDTVDMGCDGESDTLVHHGHQETGHRIEGWGKERAVDSDAQTSAAPTEVVGVRTANTGGMAVGVVEGLGNHAPGQSSTRFVSAPHSPWVVACVACQEAVAV